MTTTVGDAKIKLSLDTSEAEARLRRLEGQIKTLRGEEPNQRDVREMAKRARTFHEKDDSPSMRDDSRKAAATVAAPAPAYQTILKGAITAELILQAIQQSPLLLRVLRDTIIPEAWKKSPDFKLVSNVVDETATNVDKLQGKLLNVAATYGDTWNMAEATLRVGMTIPPSEGWNMLNFIQDQKSMQYAVQQRARREIKETVADFAVQSILDSFKNAFSR